MQRRRRQLRCFRSQFLQGLLPAGATILLVLTTGIPPVHAKGVIARLQSPQILDATRVHDVGQIHTLVTNWGLVGSMPGSSRPYSGLPSAQWPAGQGNAEYLWAGGLWVGAIKNGEPHVSTVIYESEFRPGASELDHMYVTHEGAPGGARRPSLNADDDHDGKTDEDPLDGRDNDGDGLIDEDFAAISPQMFSCEYSDTDTAIVRTSPAHVPLEISVQQSSLAWATGLDDDFIAFDLRVINRGFNPLDNVYMGFFADCDIGQRTNLNVAEDDRAGFWEGRKLARIGNQVRNVSTSIGYMYDADSDAGAAPGYIGFLFLGTGDPHHPSPANQSVMLRNFRMFSGRAAFQQGGDPNNDAERYKVLSGAGPDSLPLPDPESGFRPAQVATRDADYRILVSVGPFEVIEPGDTLTLQMAMVIGQGLDGLISNAVSAQLLYDGAWYDCDRDPTTGVLGRETPVCAPRDTGFFRINPCDSTCDGVPPGTPGCYVQVPDNGCEWINGDCLIERETGVETGVDGAECVVHWTTPATVPVTVQDLQAITTGGTVHLTWRLADASQVASVFVLRAVTPDGPFMRLTDAGLPPEGSMSFEDRAVESGRAYWYRIDVEDRAGRNAGAAIVYVIAGSAETALAVPVQRSADAVHIEYRVGRPGPMDLAVFDVAGRRVRTLVHGTRAGGSDVVDWDRRSDAGSRLVRGIYFIRLDAGGTRAARKLVLARE